MAVQVRRIECRMAGCQSSGAPNYTCARCGRLILYFCADCQRRLNNELKILGKMEVACVPCVRERVS